MVAGDRNDIFGNASSTSCRARFPSAALAGDAGPRAAPPGIDPSLADLNSRAVTGDDDHAGPSTRTRKAFIVLSTSSLTTERAMP